VLLLTNRPLTSTCATRMILADTQPGERIRGGLDHDLNLVARFSDQVALLSAACNWGFKKV
jgi:hypothetical protein